MDRRLAIGSIAAIAIVAATASSVNVAHGGPTPVDADGDGWPSIASGGSDCDDNDPSAYPSMPEVCDAKMHDEDCNPFTFGNKDSDGDGEIDWQCCNVNPSGGSPFCGTDMDDTNYLIHRGSQVCDGANVFTADMLYQPCPTGTVCVQQPNGSGVCGIAPPGYSPPPRYTMPTTFPSPPPPPPRIFSPYKAAAVPSGLKPPVFRRPPIVTPRVLPPSPK